MESFVDFLGAVLFASLAVAIASIAAAMAAGAYWLWTLVLP